MPHPHRTPLSRWISPLAPDRRSGARKQLERWKARHLRIELLEDRSVPTGTVSGLVFQDFNNNGVFDQVSQIDNEGIGTIGVAVDRGYGGVTVTVYDAANVVRGTAVSGATGTFAINATGTGPYRVEFTNLPANFLPTPHGANNGTNVQFVPDGNSNVQFSMNNPLEFTQNNPDLVTSRYLFGDQVNGENKDGTVIRSFPYSAGTEDSDTSLFNAVQPNTAKLEVPAKAVGTTWGLGYNRFSKTIYAASLMKRHAGFGPNGTGAIYQMPTTGNSASLFVDLNAIFGAGTAGLNPHDPNDYLTDNFNATWDAVGKISFGGLDVSEDGKKLYVMNLANRTLYEIPLDQVPNAGNIRTVQVPLASVPNSTGEGNDIRPFAVTYYRGQLYVGLVNSAESTQNPDDLWAYVYKVDPVTLTFGAAPVFQIPLNYTRANVYPPAFGGAPAEWNPWVPSYTNLAATKIFVIDPQPILSGITFDADGNMVLGMMDRLGHQTGNLAPEDPTKPDFFQFGMAGGDTLRAFINVPGNLNSGWVLENNGRGPNGEGGAPQNTGQGPGNGEYYYQDNYLDTIHDEVSLGGVLQIPGFPDLVVGVFNALRNADAPLRGGVRWFNNTNGNNDKLFVMYGGPSTFGKTAGVGDFVVLPDDAPIEIGNRIWRDSNENGIQDPGEPTLSGVVVQLYDATGTILLATATTNAGGNYYFNSAAGVSTPSEQYNVNLQPNTSYQIKIDTTQPALAGLELTLAFADPSQNGFIRDSNALPVGKFGIVTVATGGPGATDHNYDVGYVQIPNPVDQASIAGFVYCDCDHTGTKTPSDPPVPGATITLTGVTTQGAPIFLQMLTGPDGGYLFTDLPSGTYQVRETQPAGFLDGLDNVGTVNGVPSGILGNDVISNIIVPEDAVGVNYNFGEQIPVCLSGIVYVDTNNSGTVDPGEIRIPGVTLTLSGVNDLGDPVLIATTTDANGVYQFCNLRFGTYSITETQPPDFIQGKISVGTLGGTVGPDSVTNIVIDQCENGSNYNFGELGIDPSKGIFLSSSNIDDVMGNPPPPLWSLWRPLGLGYVVSGNDPGLPWVNIADPNTGATILSFLAYSGNFGGGVRVATGDVNRDGISDIITAPGVGGGGHVKVFDGATGLELFNFNAYDSGINTGFFVASGDLNNDGFADIITAPGAGVSAHVKVFNGRNPATQITSFIAYGGGFNGGVKLAVGDINGDFLPDLVTGAAAGNPHVKIFNGQAIANGTFNPNNPDASALASFFPYALQFNVGSNVAVGDVDGDGFGDLVTGASIGNPHVKIYDGQAIAQGIFNGNPEAFIITQWFAYGLNFNVGANVAVGDLNNDGAFDVVTGASSGNPHVKVISGLDIALGLFNPANPDASLVSNYFPFGLSSNAGANVAAGRSNFTGVIVDPDRSNDSGDNGFSSITVDLRGDNIPPTDGVMLGASGSSPNASEIHGHSASGVVQDDVLANSTLDVEEVLN